MMPLKNKRLPIKKQAIHDYANYLAQRQSNPAQRPAHVNQVSSATVGGTNRPSVIQMASKTPPATQVHTSPINPSRPSQPAISIHTPVPVHTLHSGITYSPVSHPSPAHTNKNPITEPPLLSHSTNQKRVYPFNEMPVFPVKLPSSTKSSLPLPAHKAELSDGPYHEAVKRHCLQPGTSSGKYGGTLSLPTKPGSLAHCQNLVTASPKARVPDTYDQPQDLSTKKVKAEVRIEPVLHNQEEPLNLVKKSRMEVHNMGAVPVAHQKPLPPHPGRMLSDPSGVTSMYEGRTPPAAHQKDKLPKASPSVDPSRQPRVQPNISPIVDHHRHSRGPPNISPSVEQNRHSRGPPNRVAPVAPPINNSRLPATPVSHQRGGQTMSSHRVQPPNQMRTPTHPRALPSPVSHSQKTPLHPSHHSHVTPSRSRVTPPPSSHSIQGMIRSAARPQQQTPPSASQMRLLQTPNEGKVAPPTSTSMRHLSQPSSSHKVK